MSAKKDTVRVQMELPSHSIDRLKFLKEKTEAASYAEVSKNAYKLYEMLIKLQDSGDALFLKEKESGKVTELKLFP